MPSVGVTRGRSRWSLELAGESELECFERARVEAESSEKDRGSRWGLWLAPDPLATSPPRLTPGRGRGSDFRVSLVGPGEGWGLED